jgi:hypothetical protein
MNNLPAKTTNFFGDDPILIFETASGLPILPHLRRHMPSRIADPASGGTE